MVNSILKKFLKRWVQWLMPVIPAAQGEELEKIAI
jgi:hypothetical protein